MLVDVCGITVNDMEVVPGGSIVLKKALNPVSMNVEDISIPIDDNGMLYVNWAGSRKEGKDIQDHPVLRACGIF